ncbi:murein hydrolase activator EnvC family protein [Cochlodiniinecator piscidefendens]|uniref:murein hydrolase activator EnvC family protein n=1 Tax=Cochlodiniinecator piscidefendens TaxID=2715756 RepID=UPI0038B3B0B8
MLRAITCAAALTFPATLIAQVNPADIAARAAQQLETASIALQEANQARDRVAALTQTIQAYEEGLGALREGLRQAAVREAAIAIVFDAKREQIAQLLGVLQSMQNAPAPVLLLHPSGPMGTARSGMILSEITPALQAQADELRFQLEEVSLLRALQEGAAATLLEGLKGVQDARTALSQAISDRTELPIRFTEDPAQLQALLQSSETLSGFADGLADLPETDLEIDTPDFASAQGELTLPVSGTVLRRFGETDAAGVVRPGLLIATRPSSLVTAPWPATLRYRGPLLDYGNVMILEPEEDTLLVLAGLGIVYGEVGEVVSAGAALGLMPQKPGQEDGILLNVTDGSGNDRTETLYIELRQGNDPVDPAIWFAINEE